MGLSKNHQCYIAVPSHIVNSHLQNMLSSEKKITPLSRKFKLLLTNPRFWIFLVFLFGFVGLWLDFLPFSQNPCSISRELFTESEFWKQPDGLGYRPCLNFSKTGREILKDKTRYLMVVVSGGMNQQRNQIVDAVVIARILEAALVVPIFQVNPIWADERFALYSGPSIFTLISNYLWYFELYYAVSFLIFSTWIISKTFWGMTFELFHHFHLHTWWQGQ